MKNVSDKLTEKIKIHIFLFSKFFFVENLTVYEIIWGKYCRAGQARDENMTHAHSMLDT